jgi:hypothetical protein
LLQPSSIREILEFCDCIAGAYMSKRPALDEKFPFQLFAQGQKALEVYRAISFR